MKNRIRKIKGGATNWLKKFELLVKGDINMSISKIKEINKKFDEKWKRMRDNGFGKKVSLDGRMIWDVSNENDEESEYVFADESIKSFYTQQILSLIEELIPKYNKYDAEKDLDKWYGFQEAVDQMRASIKELKKSL